MNKIIIIISLSYFAQNRVQATAMTVAIMEIDILMALFAALGGAYISQSTASS